jgi:hypothetical protein
VRRLDAALKGPVSSIFLKESVGELFKSGVKPPHSKRMLPHAKDPYVRGIMSVT